MKNKKIGYISKAKEIKNTNTVALKNNDLICSPMMRPLKILISKKRSKLKYVPNMLPKISPKTIDANIYINIKNRKLKKLESICLLKFALKY
jgi:hypothetical protein